MMNILSVRGCMFIKALRCDEHPFSTWLYVVEALRCDEHPFSTWLYVVEALRCDEHPQYVVVCCTRHCVVMTHPFNASTTYNHVVERML